MGRGKAIETVYPLSEMHEVTPLPRLNLEGIEEKKCYAPNDGAAYWYVVCDVKDRYRGGCPKCGCIGFHAHGSAAKRRLIHDVNVGMRQVDISLSLPRYKCNDCGQTFMYPLESIVARRCVTTRLLEQIQYEAFQMEFSEVAKRHRISDSMVEYIFDDYSKCLFSIRDKEVKAPRVLGIDEKHIVHHMRGVLVDVETGEPLNLLPDNKPGTMMQAIMSLDGYENIEVVTMDMANGYRDMVQTCLPQATIVIDRFHVIQNMMVKVKRTKTKIHEHYRKTITDSKCFEAKLLDKLAKNAYLFKFGKERLRESPYRAQLMADLCQNLVHFNHLRILKERFEDIYHANNRNEAEAKYKEWAEFCSKTDKTMFAEFYTLRNSMNYWMPYILNYFNPGCRETNATTEGINSLIERHNIKGSGYSFERLRAKLLLHKLATRAPEYVTQKIRVTTGKHTPFNNASFWTPSHATGTYCESVVAVAVPDEEDYEYQTLYDMSTVHLYNELGENSSEDIVIYRTANDNDMAEEEVICEDTPTLSDYTLKQGRRTFYF